MADFIYQEPFPVGEDKTQYRLLTKDYVKVVECDGRKILKVDPAGLELLSKAAYSDVSFYLRAAHLQKLRNILDDPEATDNDKFVAYTMLLNQVVAAEGELPTCQDTGTAICIGHKGEDVYTGADDAKCIAKGVYETYKDRNLLFAGRAFHDDRGEEFRYEPPGTDRYLRRPPRHGVRIPLHYQGRRLGQQDLPLPADQGAAEREIADRFHQDPYLRPRYVGLPALPPGHLHRRYVGRDVPLDREEGFGRLPRRVAHFGQRGRPLLP